MESRRSELTKLALALNLGAGGRRIGTLQEKRAVRKGLKRIAANLFSKQSIKDDYAFHSGGLSELQFNIGFEEGAVFRHGVAFSLQPTRYTPDISTFAPRIRRFNEFLQTYPEAYADFSMWYFERGTRSDNFAPMLIPDTLFRPHIFIMLGKVYPEDKIKLELILNDFDRLMPLYEYVEGHEPFPARLRDFLTGFVWSPGNVPRVECTRIERTGESVDTALRHNILQAAFYEHLLAIHGNGNVSGEQDCGNGTPVDVAVRTGERFCYYEIKTGLSARSCIRQAFGQLMEYAFWPGAQEAVEMVIVGEPPLDPDAEQYLNTIRRKFGLPLSYKQFDLEMGMLIEQRNPAARTKPGGT